MFFVHLGELQAHDCDTMKNQKIQIEVSKKELQWIADNICSSLDCDMRGIPWAKETAADTLADWEGQRGDYLRRHLKEGEFGRKKGIEWRAEHDMEARFLRRLLPLLPARESKLTPRKAEVLKFEATG